MLKVFVVADHFGGANCTDLTEDASRINNLG